MFGGCWIPNSSLICSELERCEKHEHARTLRGVESRDGDLVAFACSAPAVQAWVNACRAENPAIKRRDVCQPLQLPTPFSQDVMQTLNEMGLYLAALTDGGNSVTFSLWYELPLRARVCNQPAWCRHKTSKEIKYVDEVHQLCHFVSSDPARFQASLDRVVLSQPHIVWLGQCRYAGCSNEDWWGLSLRATRFLHLALETNSCLGRPAAMIACLIDAELFGIDPFKLDCGASSSTRTANPLCRFLMIMEDVETFIAEAKTVARDNGMRLHELGLQVKRLTRAGCWLRYLETTNWFEECAPLGDERQADELVGLLARVFPEQVAVKTAKESAFYAGGFRVRGKSLGKVPTDVEQVFLLGPSVERYSKPADAHQVALKASEVVPLPTTMSNSASQPRVVFVSDSSLSSAAFVYGIQLLLHAANVRLLWMCVRFGATAADLSASWSKAPPCNHGVTIYNGNDFLESKDVSVGEVKEDVLKLVECARKKCDKTHFICNDPRFFRISINPKKALVVLCAKSLNFYRMNVQLTCGRALPILAK